MAAGSAVASVWAAMQATHGNWPWWLLSACFVAFVFAWAGGPSRMLPSCSPRQDRALQVMAGAMIIMMAVLVATDSAQ